jgi:mRNA-degrading endonuclease RelE of RelBE toxin-antitoxin system
VAPLAVADTGQLRRKRYAQGEAVIALLEHGHDSRIARGPLEFCPFVISLAVLDAKLCYSLSWPSMYQIVFSEISASELAKIPKEVQLELLAEFHFLPDNLDHLDSKAFGVIEREGKKLYRYRANDYRIYFQRSPEGIVVHRVLHKNTIRDFLFRSKLPMAEDEQLEKSSSFWKLIEEGERTKREE